LYHHKVVHINYTTYDIRRAQDSLNPRTHADLIVLALEDDEQNPFLYWFGQIVGVFHADILHTGPACKTSEIQQMDFLWVWWFGRDKQYKSGFKVKQLHHIRFLDGPEALRFLDPKEII